MTYNEKIIEFMKAKSSLLEEKLEFKGYFLKEDEQNILSWNEEDAKDV